MYRPSFYAVLQVRLANNTAQHRVLRDNFVAYFLLAVITPCVRL